MVKTLCEKCRNDTFYLEELEIAKQKVIQTKCVKCNKVKTKYEVWFDDRKNMLRKV